MASIRKRGDFYYIDYRVDGKRVRQSVGKDLKKAEATLATIEARQAASKKAVLTKLHSIKNVSVQLRQYCREVFAPNTQAKYNSILNNFLGFLTKRFSYIETINDIHSDVLDQFKEERRKEGVAPRTINAELTILGKFFALLVNWHYLAENPLKKVERLSKEDRRIPRILNDDEVRKLLEAAPSWFYPILFTLLNTGLRKHELEDLPWDDVDLDRRIIHVRFKGTWIPKEQERDIPINEGLLRVLLEQKKKAIDSPLLFPDEHRLKYHHNRLRRHLIRLAKQCGIDGVSQLHILRHTFAAQLIKRGVDLNTLRDLLGHNDIKTTMIYAHLTQMDKKKAVEGLNF